jgi:predicted XRE-type DNA-binding protein
MNKELADELEAIDARLRAVPAHDGCCRAVNDLLAFMNENAPTILAALRVDAGGGMTEDGFEAFEPSNVVAKILLAMNSAGIKQRQLAAKLNLTEARVSQMLRCSGNLTLRSVCKIAAAIEALSPKGGSHD